jgi:hypothetical protein
MSLGTRRLLLMGRKSLGQTLAPIFSANPAGLWLDPSDLSTAWQESTKVTGGVVSQPVGYRASKLGNVPGVLQATAGSRPLLDLTGTVYSDVMDGTDDGYLSAAFAAAALTTNMDVFVALKRNSAARGILAYSSSGGAFIGGFDAAGGATLAYDAIVGTPTFVVNGVPVPGGTATTRVQLNAALPAGGWLIVEIRNLDLSTWTGFGHAGYATFLVSGNYGGVIACAAQSDATRALIRRGLGAKVGLSL